MLLRRGTVSGCHALTRWTQIAATRRLRLDGVLDGRGRLLDVPVMSGNAPAMPVLVDRRVQVAVIRPESLRKGGRCAAF